MAKKSLVKLTEFSPHCGCAAKVGAASLHELMKKLPACADPRLLVGIETFDDAAVYQIDKDTAIVQTVDFFPPIVDDPYLYGQIAACNALSDVYAMGGKPLTCLAIVCFPTKKLSLEILRTILQGGLDKVHEAGALVVGGHTIEDEQPKYGLAVTGIIHPDKIITNARAQEGDLLVLTKPLGTGIMVTAAKAGLARDISEAIDSMRSLNKAAAEVMQEVGVHAATDVTGFSLLGHLHQMLLASKKSAELWVREIPFLSRVEEFAQLGMIPEGAHRNRAWLRPQCDFAEDVPIYKQDILFDPQTSGGLLAAVSEKKAQSLMARLHDAGITPACVIGKINKEKSGGMTITGVGG